MLMSHRDDRKGQTGTVSSWQAFTCFTMRSRAPLFQGVQQRFSVLFSRIPIMTPTRRTFVIHSVVGASVLATGSLAFAQTLVLDTDPQAIALGYKNDASKADKAKYPKYAAGQNCANCALYQAKAGDAAGACPLFAGKQVSAKAWCSAWAKKA
jgi:hypothetical protein